MKISTKLTLIYSFSVAAAIALTTVLLLGEIRRETVDQANIAQEGRLKTFWTLLKTKGDEFRVENDKLYVGEYLINGNFELPDKIKEIFGGTATIFMGDTRVTTNVIKDGSRAIGTKLQGLAYDAIFKEKRSYRGETTILGIPYFTAYDPIKNSKGETIGVLYVGVKKSEYFATYDSLKFKVAAVAAVMVVVFGLVAILLTRRIMSPLASLTHIARRIADGNLNEDVPVRSRDEIGILAEAFKSMVGSLKEMIGKIRDTSSQVATAASQITSSSVQLTRAAHSQATAAEETSSTMVQMAASIQTVAGNAETLAVSAEEQSSSMHQLGASSEQVAQSAETMASSVTETSATIEQMIVSIEKVAKNTEDLAASVTETSSTVEQMSASIEQVARNSQELQQVAGETAAIVEGLASSIKQVAKNVTDADTVAKSASQEGYAGQKAVQEALTAMKRVAEVIEKTAASIVNLGKRSEEIGGIVNVISEIADQTNLLALNAAIEAARAGDAGRGFAVVAEEVRKLAERSMVATKEIGQVINQVQTDTSTSVKYGELAAKEAQSSMDLSVLAGNALANIVRSIEQTSSLMSEVAAMTGEQAEASTQVINAVEKMNLTTSQVASAAHEQALGGRQIRTAIERMNGITQEVTGSTREQALGSKQIRAAVDNMNQMTHQVSISTREQTLSARQIVDSVGVMNTKTQQVANATTEQKAGGDLVVRAVENISDLTRENLASVEQLAMSAENLSGQAAELAAMVEKFRVY
jgi:methyl-accepting chemotaxis protein